MIQDVYMSNGARYFTADDERYIREHYKDSTYAEIAEALGRTEGSVKARASVLGLTKKAHRWTLSEDGYLRRWHGIKTPRQMAADMDIDYDIVRRRMATLHLNAKRPTTLTNI